MADPALWIAAVSTVGFPIVITVYLLARFERVLGENTKAATAIQSAVLLLVERMRERRADDLPSRDRGS